MKKLRLIVALRLAIFPLILNLTFAEELDVSPEISVISTLNEVNEEKSIEQIETNTPMDSSADESASEWQTWSAVDSSLYSEWQKIESFWTEWNGSEESYVWDGKEDVQDSSLHSEWHNKCL